ncbi:MAG: SDR family NAD(P)-dependent oxidoreductase [bacterium]
MEKVVLITGAASGLGRALAGKFLSEGYLVIATDLDTEGLRSLPGNGEVLRIAMDVTSEESVKQAFREVKERGLAIDVIINNAGIDKYFPLSEAPLSEFKKIFEVNLFGGYCVNQVFLPIVRSPGGRIIHISSESLNLTIPFMTYPLTKKALEGYAKVIRQELRFHGIDVVLVRPGAIQTRLLETVKSLQSAVGSQRSEIGKWKLEKQLWKFAEGAAKEIGKTLSPEEVAGFVFRVSEIKNPSAVYRINNMLQLKIAAFLPFSLTEWVIRRRLTK